MAKKKGKGKCRRAQHVERRQEIRKEGSCSLTSSFPRKAENSPWLVVGGASFFTCEKEHRGSRRKLPETIPCGAGALRFDPTLVFHKAPHQCLTLCIASGCTPSQLHLWWAPKGAAEKIGVQHCTRVVLRQVALRGPDDFLVELAQALVGPARDDLKATAVFVRVDHVSHNVPSTKAVRTCGCIWVSAHLLRRPGEGRGKKHTL